ncbi:MAG: transglutaminase-like domain-containing protein, partial [Thermoguttaceae bacterium]
FEETELGPGTRRRLLRIDTQTAIGSNKVRSTIWTDEQGEIYKEQIAEMFNFVAVRGTRQEALEEVSRPDFDLGKLSAVPVQRALPDPHRTRRVVYRVHLQSSDPAAVFDNGSTQTVVAEDGHTARLTVYSVRPGESGGNLQAPPDGPGAGDLEPNSLIQSDDQTVVQLAQQAAGDAQTPREVAIALEKWLSTRMTSLGVSSAFATAAEVARTFKGDCTEHAVLLTALARARKIPARVAIGLVYVRQEFLYHMWTEVYIDEHWVPLDATLGQGGIGAAHLKITDSNLQGASPNAAFLPVTEVIGQLKIEILEVE